MDLDDNRKWRELAPWLIAVVLYVGLVKYFISDKPENYPLLDIVVGIPLAAASILLLFTPPFVIYASLRESHFLREHPSLRPLLIMASCVVPLTALFVAGRPVASKSIMINSPTFAGVWLLLTFASSAFLAFLCGYHFFTRDSAEDTHGDLERKPSNTTIATSVSSRPPSGQLTFPEFIAVLSGIATILGIVYTIARDLFSFTGR